MRKQALAFAVVLAVALAGGTALADHFDGNAATGSFNPQLSVAISNNVVDRASTISFDMTQQDHEDPPVWMWLRSPGDWQFAFATTTPAKKPDLTPATRCEDALDNHGNSPNGTGSTSFDYSKRTDATVARAEKIGNGLLRIAATGITRPGAPAQWNGDLLFISYNAGDPLAVPPVPASAKLCLFLITTDTRVTTIPDTNPDPSDDEDDIENVTELVLPFTLTQTGSSWEVYSDISSTIKEPVFQAPSESNPAGVDVSVIQLKADFFGNSVGNWNAGGSTAFSRASHVSGNKMFEGLFRTCPADDPSFGGCKSGRPDVLRQHPKQIILPAPAITQPAAGSTDNDGIVTVGGTADAFADVNVVENGSQVGSTATANASGAWQTDISFPEGSHTVTARTVDAGGASVASNARTFNVDTPPATPAITSPSSGEVVGAGAVTVAGTAQPLSNIKIYEGGASPVATTQANTLGEWSTTVNVADKGAHSFTATASDAGGESLPAAVAFEVTTAVPVIVTPAEGGAFNVTTVALSGVSEPGSTVKIFEGGVEIASATADTNGDWSVDHVFTEDVHVITATAIGLDTLVSPPSPDRTFEVDLQAPAAPEITSPEEGAEAGSATLVIAGTSEALATIILSENGVPFATGTANASGAWSIPAQLSVDPHTVVAVAKDKAGNVSDPSAPRSFIVVQSILITTPDENAHKPKLVTVSGLSDPTSSSVKIYSGANPPLSATPIGTANVTNGSWSTNINFANGTQTITARSVINGVLSPLSAPRTFVVDGSAPVVNVVKPASAGLAIMIPGEAMEGNASDALSFDSRVKSVTVSFFNAGGSFVKSQAATCTGCPGGNVTWSLVPNITPGIYGVQVRALDGVGNVSAVRQLTIVIVNP